MKSTALLILLAIVVVISADSVAGDPKPTDRDRPTRVSVVQLGAVLPLTGDVASYGTGSKEGVEFAVDEANKAQSRYRFEVTFEDSKGDPKTALNALQSILARGKPVAVIGENISSATLAMVPVINAAKVVLVSPSASAPSLSGKSRYFFRVFPSDTEEGDFMAGVIKKYVPNAKVCIVYVNNDYGVGLKVEFAPFRGRFTAWDSSRALR